MRDDLWPDHPLLPDVLPLVIVSSSLNGFWCIQQGTSKKGEKVENARANGLKKMMLMNYEFLLAALHFGQAK